MHLPFNEDSPLELSTQLIIQEAKRRGHQVEILDELDNFICVTGRGHREYIKQGTRTSADPYIVHYLMENKWVTRQVLQEAGLPVAGGTSFTSLDQARTAAENWQGKAVVIKPNNTNFGKGISMLTDRHNQEAFLEAAERAFQFDKRILLEDWIEGTEYRFLVIGGKTRAVLERVPARVIGDGHSTIQELVALKNTHPYRGNAYKLPLEKIRLGQIEMEMLAEQKYSPSSVPPSGEEVFLRSNSNISTGGDSIDHTDDTHPLLKEMAVAAAEAVGTAITGIDIITRKIRKSPAEEPACIIEMNFNPALHIHSYPAEGKGRAVEKDVLDLLDL